MGGRLPGERAAKAIRDLLLGRKGPHGVHVCVGPRLWGRLERDLGITPTPSSRDPVMQHGPPRLPAVPGEDS